jgi:hypothetical protein
MKPRPSYWVAASLFWSSLTATATPRYVNLNNPAPLAPYTNWLSAATNIQDAVDEAAAGDEVVVTNGLYATGGRAVYGTMTNRVAIDKALTVCSVNGPLVTIIEGRAVAGTTNGDGAIRCVYVGNNAVLSGFTLTNGHTRTDGDYYNERYGGGVWCEVSGVVTNCTASGNSAAGGGGGAYSGTLNNCTLTGNSAEAGGGAYGESFATCTLNNCTLTGNSARNGGGACYGILQNCTLTGNSAGYSGGGAYCATLNNCTLTGNSAVEGGGAYGGSFATCTLNNCIAYHNTAPLGSNCGAYCSLAYCCTTPLPAGTGNFTNEPLFVDTNGWSNMRLEFGSPCIDAGNNAYAPGATDLDGHPRIVGGTVDIGAYEFQAHYVAPGSANPVPPYYSWATAATNIQDAIDVAESGETILVTNGVYAAGARAVYGMSNRVAVTRPVTVRSVNGPAVTHLVGYHVPGTTNGPAAVRCVYLGNGAVLSGFTLTNGATQSSGDTNRNMSGGGVWCETTGVVVSNCVLSGNAASQNGGGAYLGTLFNCTLSANSAACGGGSFGAGLNQCLVTGNSASANAGGACWGTYNNSVLSGNRANQFGGGAQLCTLNNCTLVANSAAYGGGGSSATFNNCILYYNTAGSDGDNWKWSTLNYCCTAPLPGGAGNFTNAPLFVNTNGWNNLRLQAVSSCISAGNNARAYGTDLDGNPRIIGDAVDVGAYEFQSIIHYVALTSTNADPPYTSWATAATSIQDAIETADAGAVILVSNGLYQTGAQVYGISNRVAVTKPVTVRSLNGPAVTRILGAGPNGAAAVRCVYLTNGAVLAGFTLTNGATHDAGEFTANRSGGGIWCESSSAVVLDCVLTGNRADYGGGAWSGTLNNCALTGNAATWFGGGAYYSTLNNCTLTGNSASSAAGGATEATLNNCIVYYNTAPGSPNYFSGALNYCCTTPLPPAGTGNFTNEPLFVDTSGWSNLRLQLGSPCIDSGNNAYTAGVTDLGGYPRIIGGTVDIGAYEFQLDPFHVWLAQYGLPTDGSADYTDTDTDGHNNWQEWYCRTCPTNALSVLRMLSASNGVSGVTLTWSSVANRTYALERATNLGAAPAFSVLQSNLAGLPDTTSFTDTNDSGPAPRFYRVRVGN